MATHAEGKSLSKLEREAEHTRADLIHTVDELHSRLSPRTFKEEVKAYARETSNELIHNLERKARENPLQAVAVAAGLAYPTWRFLINIPAPILLVGAGLALSQFGGSSQRSPESGDGEQLKDTLTRTVQDASSQVAQAVGGVKERVADATAKAKATVKSGLDAVRSQVAAAINDTSSTASETMTAASEAVAATYRSGIEAASRTGDQLTDSFRQSKDSLIETLESHPFLVGGVGLLLGAVIASALPVTQTENRLFGDSSEAMTGIALLAGAAIFLIPTLVLLLMALAAWLVEIGITPSLAHLIAGVAGLLVAAILGGIGLNRLKTDSFVPQRTLDQLQQDAAAAREHV